jgi:hypothetical protein
VRRLLRYIGRSRGCKAQRTLRRQGPTALHSSRPTDAAAPGPRGGCSLPVRFVYLWQLLLLLPPSRQAEAARTGRCSNWPVSLLAAAWDAGDRDGLMMGPAIGRLSLVRSGKWRRRGQHRAAATKGQLGRARTRHQPGRHPTRYPFAATRGSGGPSKRRRPIPGASRPGSAEGDLPRKSDTRKVVAMARQGSEETSVSLRWNGSSSSYLVCYVCCTDCEIEIAFIVAPLVRVWCCRTLGRANGYLPLREAGCRFPIVHPH